MNNPLIIFGFAILNVGGFECLYGIFYKILPSEKGSWCVCYWITTLALCSSMHIFDSLGQQKLDILLPAALVAVIHIAASFETGPMEFSRKGRSDDKQNDNPSSFSSRVNDAKDGSKEIK